MSRKRNTADEIISKLRQAEVLMSQEKTVSEVVRQLEISEQTYYRWKKEYGGLDKRPRPASSRSWKRKIYS